MSQNVTPEMGRVLLVEDDSAQRFCLEGLLADGFLVSSARSVAEAMRVITMDQFDAVLTDYSLPDGVGLDVLRAIKQLSVHTTGMLVTAHNELPEVLAARNNPLIFRLILKPYDPQMLLGWVGSAVTLSRMRRSGSRRKVGP